MRDLLGQSPIGTLVPITGTDARREERYRRHAFVPAPLPTEVPLSQRAYKVLTEAERALGRLDSASRLIPNPQILIRPTLFQEAMSTSALEGTYAPLMDVLEADYLTDQQQSEPVREIRSYTLAAFRALELIEALPICQGA